MFKQNKIKILISSVLILSPILIGLLLCDKLPEQMAVHWGFDGKADGYTNAFTAVFVLPMLLLLLHLLGLFVTSKDPKSSDQTPKAFNIIFWIVPVISLFSNGLVYSFAFGKTVNVNWVLPIIFGLLLIVIGNYMPKIKQNRTLGIKIKWTLENEENWNATHRFCGKLWVIGGILMLFTIFLPQKAIMPTVLILMLFSLIPPIIYSYNYKK